MSEQQISKLASSLVEHQSAFGSMPTDDRQWVIQNTKSAIVLFIEAMKNRPAIAVTKLLEFVKTVSLPAVGTFVAAEKFRPGETIDGINVGWLGDNFKANFLGKTEDQMPALKIREHKLLKGSRDPAIITELGGEEKVEISLGQFWEFLKTADQSLWYVVYIRNDDNVLWAVHAHWLGGGLSVGANSLDDPNDWDTDNRFLSRNSIFFSRFELYR